ncbi:MBL fold metallo-hydrolase [Roseibacillus persicicus]|uniref:Ysh1p: subunit of polyadenylation factor I n=1 Tax=Roseibacillus persicicus TaxID=454148 RepID=A0A918TQ45_9BACT|nr:MBL fold metallo-hydrolase [Roseibacillus persicicus]MDQ8191919.1 MBL fold metallo-hydrolase [Roseibacillus persicicus]GHC58311.1 Ysh1p: subunit of polyadenylation factor I [Roseibacillus persicicus]
MSHAVTLRSLCRAPEIGANSYHLSFGDTNIVIDAGMHPKQDGDEAVPQFHLLDANSVDAIFVSHAHLDHIGTLPVLQREQPHARVYMTPEVVDLADALLHNSVNVMTSQGDELGIDAYPLFTHGDLDELSQVWQGQHYRKTFEPFWDQDLQVTFRDAGHVLGSAGILFEAEGKRVFYTGDVQFNDQTLIKGADFEDLGPLDALIVETTRGNAPSSPDFDREAEVARLIEDMTETLHRNGSVLIPVFAMGKTQEVLTMIQNAKEAGDLPDVPVTIGGLSTKMTTIYDRYATNANRKRPDFRILRDMELRAGTRRRGKSVPIRYQEQAIYALSSGMMSEHTVSNKFARNFLPNPANSVHFVGYSDPSTPSYHVRQASTGDLISLDESKDPVQLNCQVEEYQFSGHSTREQLLDFIVASGAKKIFLVHGDLSASQWFERELAERMPDAEVTIPEPGVDYTL